MTGSILSLLSSIPQEIVKPLVFEFIQIHKHFFLGKYQISELNGGRFGESVLRIIEFLDTGNYTPIGTMLNRKKIVFHVSQNTTLDNSIRKLIPTATELIMDFRNGRDVAHLGKIDVNEMDSTFVINTANWIMSEIVRISSFTTSLEAQNEIKKIIIRKIPVVEEIDGRLKTLNPQLTTKERVLVCLYQKYPNRISVEKLLVWIKDKNPSRFKKYLAQLDKIDLIDYDEAGAKLTLRGNLYIEKNIAFQIQL